MAYTVKKNDTLSQIALDNNTTVDELVRLNGIQNPNLIYTGQTIKLPGDTEQAQTAAQQNTSSASATNTTATATASPIKGVTQSQWDEYQNTTFQKSDATTQAWELVQQLQGKLNADSKWTENLDSLVNEILNYDKFTYDANTDPMYQAMLSQAQSTGEKAMRDTVARVAAANGGYGNSYGQTAGQAAYNQYLQEANALMPEYMQLARSEYQQDLDNIYGKLSMLQQIDANEFDRINAQLSQALGAYDRLYGEDKDLYSDKKSTLEKVMEMQNSEYWNDYNAQFAKEQFEYEKEQDRLAASAAADQALAKQREQEAEEYNAKMDRYLEAIVDAKKEMSLSGLAQYLSQIKGQFKEAEYKTLLELARISSADIERMNASARQKAMNEASMIAKNKGNASDKAQLLAQYKGFPFYDELAKVLEKI